MCCLKYEQEHYEQTRKIMPRIGREVITPDGTGVVTDLNIVKETVFVRIANGDTSEIKEYSLEKIERPGANSVQQDHLSSGSNEVKTDNSDVRNHPENVNETVTTDAVIQNKNEIIREEEKNTGAEECELRRNERNQVKSRDQNRQDRHSQLGKPVLRENPNRKPPQNSDTVKNPDKPVNKPAEIPSDKQEEKATSKSTRPSTNWSEAVRKAIDSMH